MKKPWTKVCKLPLNEYTEEGAYYAKVDGKVVGENGRSHWETYDDALACGQRFIEMKETPNDR